jgi:hypothetical protein
MLPVGILSVVMATLMITSKGQMNSFVLVEQLVIMVLMIPYIYLIYKWMFNINYKEFHITWETGFWESCGKIALEMALTIITAGIYGPMAFLRLYEYFSQRTLVKSDHSRRRFGYEIDPWNDFLLMWGQTLLIIITLGIYYPWATCKIGKRILSKTYLIED